MLEKEKGDLDIELQNLNENLTGICIKARNDYVTKQMGIDFAEGVVDLYRELEEEIDENDGNGESTSAILSDTHAVQTFCVCSKAYQKLLGRFKTERLPSGFQRLQDTMIPQLQDYCREFTLGAREKMANDFLEDLARMKLRIQGWGDNSTPDKQITKHQKRLLEAIFRERTGILEQV
jgi:hypothetical protein